ncbi:MAG: serine/threonine-protein kinase [Kofleriaceae bacterium]
MDAGSEQRQLSPGTMLDDKYRVEELLAVGGMGAVYVGTHTKLRKRVAIKVLNPQLSSPQMIERFHREAITASQVGHEGIAQVTDLGTSLEGEPFLVMELLEGESLGKRLRAATPLPIETACELTCSILAPLDAAHRAGIVHRDLKPDNVFLVQQSRGEMVKLLDFGISRATGLETEFRLTTTGLVLGTPYYMSPEQAQGRSEITPASDLYSVGVILYEMLIGRVPIQGDNYNQLMYHVVTGTFTPPRQLRPEIPAGLERIVLRAMALEPAQRHASAAEFEHELLAFCRPTFRAHAIDTGAAPRIGSQTPPPRATPHPWTPGLGTDQTVAATPSALSAYAAPTPTPPRARGRGPWIAAALALAGLGVAAAFVVPRGSPASARGAEEALPDEAVPDEAAAPAAPVPAPPEVTPVAAVPAPAPAAPVPPAPAKVRLTFSVEPPQAVLTLDEQVLHGAEHEVEADDGEHHLEVAAEGFVSETLELRYDTNQRVVVKLKPAAKAPRRRPRVRAGTITDDPAPRRPARPDRIDRDSPYKQ